MIWVDGGSASASEVLAGSLHDNCKAVIMGEKSFGKGLIQAVYGLKNGAGLVLTVAKYVTPNQNEIQGIGITPDVSGKNIVPPLLPGIGTDTSKIDFVDIKTRLSSTMCTIPKQWNNMVLYFAVNGGWFLNSLERATIGIKAITKRHHQIVVLLLSFEFKSVKVFFQVGDISRRSLGNLPHTSNYSSY